MADLAMTDSMIPDRETYRAEFGFYDEYDINRNEYGNPIYSLYPTMAIVYMKREYQGTFTSEPAKATHI